MPVSSDCGVHAFVVTLGTPSKTITCWTSKNSLKGACGNFKGWLHQDATNLVFSQSLNKHDYLEISWSVSSGHLYGWRFKHIKANTVWTRFEQWETKDILVPDRRGRWPWWSRAQRWTRSSWREEWNVWSPGKKWTAGWKRVPTTWIWKPLLQPRRRISLNGFFIKNIKLASSF